MRIGVVTRYFWSEATEVAAAIVSKLDQLGHDVEIVGIGHRPGARFHQPLDRRVLDCRHVRFTAWLPHLDAVVWTHTPTEDVIRFARRSGRLTVVYPLWTEWLDEHLPALQAADRVLCAFSLQQKVLRELGVKAAIVAGISAGEPAFSVPRRSREMVLPIYGRWLDTTPMAVFDAVRQVLADYTGARLCVLYQSSRLNGVGGRQLRSCQKEFGDRVTLRRVVDLADVDNAMIGAGAVVAVQPLVATGLPVWRAISVGANPVFAANTPLDAEWPPDEIRRVAANEASTVLTMPAAALDLPQLTYSLAKAFVAGRTNSQERLMQLAAERDQRFERTLRDIFGDRWRHGD